jgi:type IV pilus assembly protein PilW
MISLTLGLIVVGSVIAIFLSNKQSYATNTAFGEIQDNSRVAFELLARDIRQAGLTGCGNQNRVANVLNDGPNAGGTVDWWADFNNAIHGYDGNQTDPAITTGTGVAQRVAGTSSLQLIGAAPTSLSVASQNSPAASFKLNETTSDLQSGDIIIVCDPDHATIAQITNYNNANVTLVHDTGNGVATPGNCSKGLGYPTVCSTNGNSYDFGPNSQITKLQAVDWYIGNNPQNGKSLYRLALASNASTATVTTSAQEMVRNVTNMQIAYHLGGAKNFVNAAAIGTNWNAVDAVQLQLQFESTDTHAGTKSNQPIVRRLSSTVTLRNRTN